MLDKPNALDAINHKLSFAETILGISDNLDKYLISPNFLLNSRIAYFQKLKLLFSEFEQYLVEVVEQGIRENDSTKNDILTSLIRGMDTEKEDKCLSSQEILANIFIFLIAGHETTAHCLCMLEH